MLLTDRQLLYICICVAVVVYIIVSKASNSKIESEISWRIRSSEEHIRNEYLSRSKELDKREGELRLQENRLKQRAEQLDQEVYAKSISNIQNGLEKANSIFLQYPIFTDFSNYDFKNNNRLQSAIKDKMGYKTTPVVSADIQGQNGTYHVTLESCTCPDFRSRHIPCKHMYRLALQLGLLSGYDSSHDQALIEEYHQTIDELSIKESNLLNSNEKLRIKKETIETGINSIKQDAMGSSWLAVQLADLEYYVDMKASKNLLYKSRPARKASEEVAAIAKEKREWMAKAKALEYQLALYELMDPSLSAVSEYAPEELSEAFVADNEDTTERYLSKAEYDSLSEPTKWQLALDRWRKRNRTNWQVGRDFERYIGYLYEMDGYRVEYFGALSGKMDLGRDLIARKKGETIIIQCKRWADRKIIHEKHVFQLFGSVVGYEMEHPGSAPRGLLVTTCPLSDVAIAYADRLCVDYKQNYPADALDTYPLIKCNIGRTGEKIFHLPFDQQYDRVNISPKDGEFYASTVQEAIDAGFRRAYRWHGT